jgi:hypothetical protein
MESLVSDAIIKVPPSPFRFLEHSMVDEITPPPLIKTKNTLFKEATTQATAYIRLYR